MEDSKGGKKVALQCLGLSIDNTKSHGLKVQA